MKSILSIALLMSVFTGLTACSDAKTVSSNLSSDADNFKIIRRTIFYNGINGEYILSIEGKCSIHKDGTDKQLEVTCKTGDNQYKKHYLGISDNVTYFSEQIDGESVSPNFYKVVFKPSVIVPNIEIR